MICSCCPRKCNKPRGNGYCGIPDGVFVSRFMLHKWEEPVISGKNGTAAVFFSGCNLRCCYCQNAEISLAVSGRGISVDEFVGKIKKLAEEGAQSVDLISPTPYAPYLPQYLAELKKNVNLPVVYNSGGYDLPEYIEKLRGLADVFLPDFKYLYSDTAEKYSKAPDYPAAATAAIKKMLELAPEVIIGENGIIKSGVILRHLVLPGHRAESMALVDYVAENFPGAMMSLMSQYTPDFNRSDYKNLNRKITSFEYESVVARAAERGITGFSQLRQAADKKYTPDFG